MSKKSHRRSIYAIHDANRQSFKSSVDQNEHKIDEESFFSNNEDIKSINKHKKFNSQYDNITQNSCEPSVIHLRMGETANLPTKLSIGSNERRRSKPVNSGREKVELKNNFIENRIIIADWALFFGMIGFTLMIIESEMTMYKIYLKV